jgi:hypothetical protein
MRKSKYTKELLLPIVQQSISMADVIRQLHLRLTGGNDRMISARIRLSGISTDHFKGSLGLKEKQPRPIHILGKCRKGILIRMR